MKFDFVIGNPPYQETTENTSDKPIYNEFMDACYGVSGVVELITPARFLFNAGKTPKAWNEKMLNDNHFKVLLYESNASNIFPNTDIKGGVAITYRDVSKTYQPIGIYTKYSQLNSILHKVLKLNLKSINEIIYLQNKFDLNTLYKDNLKLKNKIGSKGKEKRLTTSIFNINEIFSDDSDVGKVKILGLVKNNRNYKYISRKYLDKHVNLDRYKIVLPKVNGTGQFGETLSSPLIIEPGVGFTQSFISIGSFDTEEEASAALKYIKSKFARTMLNILKITQDNNSDVWKYVPLQNFTSSSDMDWSKSIADIDRQLYAKYGLDDDEVAFIESHVKEMV